MALAMFLRGFIALALFALAYFVARNIARAIPNGRIKDVLYDRSIQRQHPWKFALLAFAGVWGVILLVATLLLAR